LSWGHRGEPFAPGGWPSARIEGDVTEPHFLEVVAMRKRYSVLLLSLLLAVSLVSFLANSPRAADEASTPLRKWEYKVEDLNGNNRQGDDSQRDIQSGMNKLGNDGWEMVQFTSGYGFFKRPKR
jgi:hypothetical protein